MVYIQEEGNLKDLFLETEATRYDKGVEYPILINAIIQKSADRTNLRGVSTLYNLFCGSGKKLNDFHLILNEKIGKGHIKIKKTAFGIPPQQLEFNIDIENPHEELYRLLMQNCAKTLLSESYNTIEMTIPHTIEVDSKRYTFFEVMKRIDEKCYIDIQMPQEVLERKISDINRCKVDYVTTADSYEKEYEIFRIAKAVVEKAEGLGFGIDIHESKENCMAQACIPSPLLYTSEEDLTELLIKRERIEISENTGKTQKSELTLSPEKIEGICYRKSGKIYVDAVFGYIGSTPLFDGNEAAQWKKDYMRTSTKYIKTLSTGIEEFIDDALGFIFNPINSYIIEPSINKIKHPFKKYFEKKEIKEVARIREKEKRMTKVYQTMVDTGFKKAKKDKDEVTDPTARCFILVGKECKGHE